MTRRSDPRKPRFRSFDGRYATHRVGGREREWGWGWAALGVTLFFGLFSSPEQAVVRTATVMACALVIGARWDRQHVRRFWALLAALAGLHLVALLLVVPTREPWLGLALWTFPVADALVTLRLLRWVERRFPAASGGQHDIRPNTVRQPSAREGGAKPMPRRR